MPMQRHLPNLASMLQQQQQQHQHQHQCNPAMHHHPYICNHLAVWATTHNNIRGKETNNN